MADNTDGKTTLFCDIKVSVTAMRDWEPQRIVNFFCGIAQAIAAAEGNGEVIVSPDLREVLRG